MQKPSKRKTTKVNSYSWRDHCCKECIFAVEEERFHKHESIGADGEAICVACQLEIDYEELTGVPHFGHVRDYHSCKHFKPINNAEV